MPEDPAGFAAPGHPVEQATAGPNRPKLRPCPDCGHQVSLMAASCPSCGRPFRPLPRGREGPFLQTLNAGTLLALAGLAAIALLGVLNGLVYGLGELWKLAFGR